MPYCFIGKIIARPKKLSRSEIAPLFFIGNIIIPPRKYPTLKLPTLFFHRQTHT